MTCATARNPGLFDTIIIANVRRLPFKTDRLPTPRSLFDYTRDASRRRPFEYSPRPEEDLERWDGLS